MPRAARALVLSAALVLALLTSPASAMPADTSHHGRASSAGPQTGRYDVTLRRHVTYSVITRGHITASVEVFRRQARETYEDPRGWSAGGVEIRRVPSFSSTCSSTWSCRVGRFVIINQERWKHPSPPWNAAGLALRDYRHLVVNHETGHWLGRSHAGCRARGAKAPVIMPQSKGTDGCRLNPWPLPREAAAIR